MSRARLVAARPVTAHAYVTLKPAPDRPRPPRLGVGNVRDYHAPEETVGAVAARLENEGLLITGRSPLGVSVAGPPELVSRVFAAPLTARPYHPVEGPRQIRRGTVPLTLFQAETALTVPRHLSDAVDRVRLAPPIRYFATADAPYLAYYHLDVPEDVARLIDARAAHDHGFTGAGVRVCVIDSGFHPHEWYAAHGFTIALVGSNHPEDDDYGHGTGITANAMAVAPGAQFFGVKLDDGASAFQRARTVSPHVISCSWGTWAFDQPLHDEIVDAVAHGATVCFACGNGPGGAAWPGSMPEVVSVGGVFVDEHGALEASSYASSGTNPDEPGRRCPDVCGLTGRMPRGIYIALPTQDGSTCDAEFHNSGATFPDGDATGPSDGWIGASGTSSAAPAVAGVAALLLGANPALTPAQVKTALQASCRDVTAGVSANGDTAGPGRDDATGAGLVDAFIAIHPVDVWCKDSGEDNGAVPDTYPHAWTSPDVWVRAADDHGLDAGLDPEPGQANWVYVRVRNRGRKPAADVAVRLYWADPSLAIAWPTAWRTDGIKVDGAPGNVRMVGPVPPGGDAVTEAFEWWPPDPTTLGEPGHACLLVRAEGPADPVTREGDVTGDNNIAMRNVHVANVLPGMEFTFKVAIGPVKGLHGKATLTVDRSGAPREVTVGLAPGAPRGKRPPPAVRAVKSVERKVQVERLKLVRGQRQQVAVRMKAPAAARPGERYVVRLDQRIGPVTTGHATLVLKVVERAAYVGDKAALTLHRWGCPTAAEARMESRVLVRTMDAAKAMGYRPCPKCEPWLDGAERPSSRSASGPGSPGG